MLQSTPHRYLTVKNEQNNDSQLISSHSCNLSQGLCQDLEKWNIEQDIYKYIQFGSPPECLAKSSVPTVTPTPAAKKMNPMMANIMARVFAKWGPTDDLKWIHQN